MYRYSFEVLPKLQLGTGVRQDDYLETLARSEFPFDRAAPGATRTLAEE
jgi:hypothetical protein